MADAFPDENGKPVFVRKDEAAAGVCGAGDGGEQSWARPSGKLGARKEVTPAPALTGPCRPSAVTSLFVRHIRPKVADNLAFVRIPTMPITKFRQADHRFRSMPLEERRSIAALGGAGSARCRWSHASREKSHRSPRAGEKSGRSIWLGRARFAEK